MKKVEACHSAYALNWWARSFCVELKEPGQNILIAQIFRPSVGGEYGIVSFRGIFVSGRLARRALREKPNEIDSAR